MRRIAIVSSVACFAEPLVYFESSTLKNRFIVFPFVPQKRFNKIVLIERTNNNKKANVVKW